MDEFLKDSIGFIGWEFFDCVEGGGIGDSCNVEHECDRCRQQAEIHRGRA